MSRQKIGNRIALCSLGLYGGVILTPIFPATAQAQLDQQRIIVNSNADEIKADNAMTLREAIALINGTLRAEQLSESERAQISGGQNTIQFALPAGQTVIRVNQELPAILSAVVIDGTTQSGYEKDKPVIAENSVPKPIVEITPAEGSLIPRGLSIASSNVTVRGLSIYGFSDDVDDTERTPNADIFIAHPFAPPITTKHPTPANFSPFYKDDTPPKDVVIEANWLGIRPDQTAPSTNSTFGVSVFNSTGTTIRGNWIANHEGSAVITSVNAENLQVSNNAIVGNGLAGMPDAIRLDGKVDKAAIADNLICGNDGAGVYLFKPEGSAEITNNRIIYNGRRFRRAAVYLMGNNHTVKGNTISHQAGPGVVVTAYPQSRGNVIENNKFTALEGLSIDLVTQGNVSVHDFQRGDGINPMRNSENRRKDTGNGSVNAPEFVSRTFQLSGSKAQLSGKADPNARIEFYRVSESGSAYGALTESLGTTTADGTGKFSFEVGDLESGTVVSAIATDSQYGTSEPARNAIVSTEPNAMMSTQREIVADAMPTCTTPAPTPEQPPEPTQPENQVQEPIVLKIPKNVHFALDQSNISSASANVLNRIAQVLLENPNIVAEIQGHTDPRASDAYNLALGKRRANSVRNYLIRKGIDPARMTIRSLGEQQRISDGDTRLDYARDRRVELIYKDANNIEVIVQEEDLQLEPGRGVR
jgi:outer membrane protein OmpA-like peptidoglycan-associated protein